jgi:hypothetical protein
MICDNSIQLTSLVFLIKRLDFSCDLFSGYNGCFNIDWIFVCDLRIHLMI